MSEKYKHIDEFDYIENVHNSFEKVFDAIFLEEIMKKESEKKKKIKEVIKQNLDKKK